MRVFLPQQVAIGGKRGPWRQVVKRYERSTRASRKSKTARVGVHVVRLECNHVVRRPYPIYKKAQCHRCA